jgi:penicillin-binding protein 2
MAARTRSKSISRLWGLGIAFLVICAVYVIRLAVLELNSENIGGHKQDGTTERTVVVQAVRGQIYDRNGVPLVTNAYTYDLTMDYSVLPKDQLLRNDAVLKALHMLESCGEVDRFCAYDFPFDGYYPNYAYKSETSDPVSDTYDTFLDVVQTNGLRREAILRIKSEKRMNTAQANDYYDADPLSCITAERLTAYFVEEYELDAKGEDGSPLYGNADIDRLIRVLWGMEAVGFSRANDYVLAENVTMETVTHEKELGIAGIGFATKATRVYCFPGYASHILGQTGPIYAEEWPYYKELGYAMNARVGKSGCEAAFEEYLHGQDGIKVVVEDADGNIVREYMKTQPVAGKDVYLTIDINLQIAAEKALAENVRYIQNTYHREDCKAGAMVAMDPNSGALLAIASYPTYDLTTFNRDYDDLYANDALPLFNRALSGLYAPGSTFKPGMVAAALTEGTVTSSTKLECAGTYTYYQSYQPDCWIHNSSGAVKQHGWINAAEALRVSCNCYFYDLGRRLGITNMNLYCRMYGLGEATGIELGEQRGSLAGPDYRADMHGLEWQPTDTIAAAIGQSDNAFTPLQLGVYTSTLVNGGTRYAAHLLLKVRDFSERTDIFVTAPEAVNSFPLSDADRLTVIGGMEQMVATSSEVSRYMKNVPVTVAGKTGTAQTGSKSTENGLFICAAPSRNPEIVVVSVIERAGGGSYSAMSAGEVLEAYYKRK